MKTRSAAMIPWSVRTPLDPAVAGRYLGDPGARLDRGSGLSCGERKGVRRSHRLERPCPLDEVSACDFEAQPQMVAREIFSRNRLHSDAGRPVALRECVRLLEARLILGNQQMANSCKLERNRTLRELEIYFDTSI
jgi:hypothetical protein